ncbi:MAG TPA: helix-turn-helix domain-containing protein [Actinomycetota bacterium]
MTDDAPIAELRPSGEAWHGRVGAFEVDGSREECLSALRAHASGMEPLAIEVLPRIAGVSEAAAILGWDKRRVMTYVRRGSFPEPFAHLASGRIWRREDVEAFAASKRKRS